jgi:hypothetical protein
MPPRKSKPTEEDEQAAFDAVMGAPIIQVEDPVDMTELHESEGTGEEMIPVEMATDADGVAHGELNIPAPEAEEPETIQMSQVQPEAESFPEPNGVIITGFEFLTPDERSGLESFFEAMLAELQVHDDEKRGTWVGLPTYSVILEARRQWQMLIDAAHTGNPIATRKRAAHLANYAAMLFVNSTR